MSWVDLGTDVDWARRTVEQMEKVFFLLNFFVVGFFFCSTIFWHILMEERVFFLLKLFLYFDGGNCCQEIKMAEQKYSESDSTSSDSTVLVKIIQKIIEGDIFINANVKVEEEVVNEGGQHEKGRNLNRCFPEIRNCLRANFLKNSLEGFHSTSPLHLWTKTWLMWSWKSTRR